MKIGVDIDGVTADFQGGWAKAYEVWYGKQIDPEALKSWDACFDETHFKDEADFWAWTDEANIWRNLDPIPGALGAIRELRKDGHDVVFITHRHENARMATQDWIRRHVVPMPELHFTKHKWTVDRQVYIEDSPKGLLQLVERKPYVIRFQQPWNEGAPGLPADGWAEVVDMIGRIERGELRTTPA